MGNRTHQHVAKDVVGFVVVEVLVGQAAADVAEDCGVPAGAQDIINHVLRVHRHTRHARRGASSGSCVGCRRGRSAARLYVLALTQPLCRLLSSQSCVMLGRTVNGQTRRSSATARGWEARCNRTVRMTRAPQRRATAQHLRHTCSLARRCTIPCTRGGSHPGAICAACYRDQDTATRGLAGSGGLDLSLACDRGREG